MTLPTARDAVATALACLGLERIEDARVIRIPNTLALGEVELSEAYLGELAARVDLAALGDFAPLQFAGDGGLPAF